MNMILLFLNNILTATTANLVWQKKVHGQNCSQDCIFFLAFWCLRSYIHSQKISFLLCFSVSAKLVVLLQLVNALFSCSWVILNTPTLKRSKLWWRQQPQILVYFPNADERSKTGCCDTELLKCLELLGKEMWLQMQYYIQMLNWQY